MEKEDRNALETALRECREEIGVSEEQILLLRELSDIYIPLSNYNISPIVGTCLQFPRFVPSEAEVEKVILIRLAELFDDRNKSSRSFTRHGGQIIAPGYQIGEHFIWGATAMIISELEQLIQSSPLSLRQL